MPPHMFAFTLPAWCTFLKRLCRRARKNGQKQMKTHTKPEHCYEHIGNWLARLGAPAYHRASTFCICVLTHLFKR